MIRNAHLTDTFISAIVDIQKFSREHMSSNPYWCHMPLDNNSRKLLYKIAVSYYEDGLTQKQIGKRFGLSRIKVSRLLRQARELKIVQINITPSNGSHAELERALDTKYNLDEVIATTPPNYSARGIARALAPLAVESLMRSMQGKGVIAITWGTTLHALIDFLPPTNWPNVRIVQCLGGLSSPEAEINGVDLVRRMAQTLGARPLLLSSPGLVANKAIRDALLLDPHISNMLQLAAKADIALVGIGVLNQESVIIQNDILSNSDIERLQSKGAVGDIGMRFYNSQGERIDDEIDDRVIGLDLDQFKRIKRVIGVAGGECKYEAIRAALQGKLIDVLVTDDLTATRLLEEDLATNRPKRVKKKSQPVMASG
jgi:DNA-binding transcriptional regulator LsrR (DeoR family)